jgi:hypothetical protein
MLVGVLLGFFFLLQLPISGFFYLHVPGANMIQFPWRLLAFITVLMVALFALLARRVGEWSRPAALGLVLVTSLGTIALNLSRETPEVWSPSQTLENPPVINWPEYWPEWTDSQGRSVPGGVRRLRGYVRAGPVPLTDTACLAREVPLDTYLEKSYEIECVEAATLALPLAYSGLETILLARDSSWYRIEKERVAEDPRVRIRVPGGRQRVRVLLPTLGRLITSRSIPALD